MALTRVVLPTPGPPVTTSTLEVSASATADLWLSAGPERAKLIGFERLSGKLGSLDSCAYLGECRFAAGRCVIPERGEAAVVRRP